MQNKYLTLTPAGVFEAFLSANPNPSQLALQDLLAHKTSPSMEMWLEHHPYAWLAEFSEKGWIEQLATPLVAPMMPLDAFLPYVVASLSGSRRAAIASNEGFCLAKIGYNQEEADRLCAAGADFLDFFIRQEQRGLAISGRAVSLFEQADLLIPEVSFVFLWVDGAGYVLILGDEPLTNNRAFVELIWAVKRSGVRFDVKTE